MSQPEGYGGELPTLSSKEEITPEKIREALSTQGITSVDELVDRAFQTQGASERTGAGATDLWALGRSDKWVFIGPD